MADINLTGVASQLARRFKQPGSGTVRFQQDLIDATNDALRRINRNADLETRVSSVTKMEGTLTGMDEAYTDVLVDLITVNLIEQGQRPLARMETEVARMKRTMDFRIDEIRWDILNQAQNDDTDNEVDFVGLGAVG